MSWQYSDAPSHIAPEVGENLLTGDGPWSGVVLEPGAVYALSVEVNAPGETTAGWGVTVTDGSGGEYVLADPADAETVPGGQWVTVTRNLPAPAFPTTATVTLAVPTGTQARNPSMSARTGRTVLTVPGDVLAENIMASGGIVAGTPGAARVELTDEGLVAYDATGTETAQIQGEGGEFVGGEFRTSDTLPGQVTLSDTASQGSPGLSVEPEDSTGYDVLPSIGPDATTMHVRGGVADDGSLAGALFGPAGVSLYQNGPGENGTGAWVDVAGMQADLGVRPDRTDPMYESGIRAREQSVTAFSQGAAGLGDIYASPTGASISFKDPAEQTSEYTARIVSNASGTKLFFRPPGETGGRLTVDAEGIWVERETAPQANTWIRYNLEDTATMPAPEVIPVIGTNGWSADGSPTGGIIVTHSTTGRVCTARLRLTRTGDPVTFGTAYQTIGSAPGSATMWIPPELRIPATDYFDIRIPVSYPATGILFVDFATGEFRVKADTSATINTGQYITVDLTWFIPN